MMRASRLSSLVLAGLTSLGVASGGDAHQPAPPAQQRAADKVKKTQTITGKVVAYEVGDYVHAIVRTSNGREASYFIGGGPAVNCFLAAHLYKTLQLKIQTVDTYVQEAGQRIEMTRISDAQYGKLSAAAWWKSQRKTNSVEKLLDRADDMQQKHLRGAMSDEPILYAVNGWVFGVQIGKKWKEPTEKLAGDTYKFQSFRKDETGKPTEASLEWDDEGAVPTLTFDSGAADPELVHVSGPQAELVPIERIGPYHSTYSQVAKDYAASIGKGQRAVHITDGFRTDLNRDGKLDVVLALSSVLEHDQKTAEDYAVVIVRTLVGGKLKTLELVRETDFGLQRGPFQSSILAVGDFDGDNLPEFLVKTADPWGETYRMVQLTPGGKLKTLHTAGIGE